MSNDAVAQPSGPDRAAATPPYHATPAGRPMLQSNTGRVGAGGLTLAAVVIAVILGIVFWGLNSPTPLEHSAPAPSATAPPHADAGDTKG